MSDFAVWAPATSRVQLRIEGSNLPMRRADGGWWRTEVSDVKAGTDYAYLLGGDDLALPDPRSLWQPHGVDGVSRVYDHAAFEGGDAAGAGRPLAGAGLVEVHICT